MTGSRLSDARSAYLKSAAHQPVDWHPWGPEPFERARRENKPILLDIGAVWCHWCHVMDGESYEDAAIADLLNTDWICIKVDRDERPDVDTRYQRAVQLMTGQGGWPLTAFLTPDGEVFFGGTYFPPDGKHGRPGFASTLRQLASAYRENPDKVAEQVSTIREHLRKQRSTPVRGSLPADLLTDAADGMARVFDFRYGGFGSQPKFPHPTACEFLLVQWTDTGLAWAREMVDRTLAAMARGGVYDQIGGGFHRYSVDARWVVPHFEKMSYDNSELLSAYVHAAASLPKGDATALQVEYQRVIAGIVAWVTDTMSDPRGGYYASQDADVGLDDDGDYFTWTLDEAAAATTPDELAVLRRRYDIGERGEMHHNPDKNVLWIRESVLEIAAALGKPADEVDELVVSGVAALRATRASRTAPFIDTTLYVGWNAMMASAMLAAAAYLDTPDAERHALATLERIRRDAGDGDGVRHAVDGEGHGLLDDHVQLARAALDAFEATGDGTWRDWAVELMEHVWSTFRAEDGALLDRAPGDSEGLLDHPVTPVEDAPTPSPVGVAAVTMARLAEHTGDITWRHRLEALLEGVGGTLPTLGLHGASLLLAASWYLHPATHVVVVSEHDEPGRALRREARTVYHPRKVVTLVTPESATRESLPAPVAGMLDGAVPRAYVCAGTHCEPPVADPMDLRRLVATA